MALRTYDAESRMTACPTLYQLSYSGPWCPFKDLLAWRISLGTAWCEQVYLLHSSPWMLQVEVLVRFLCTWLCSHSAGSDILTVHRLQGWSGLSQTSWTSFLSLSRRRSSWRYLSSCVCRRADVFVPSISLSRDGGCMAASCVFSSSTWAGTGPYSVSCC